MYKATDVGDSVGHIGVKEIKMVTSELKNQIKGSTAKYKRRFYDIVFIIAFLCCLVPGPLPSLVAPASILLTLCVFVSFFDENFYIYSALFIYIRYYMLIGDTPVFRIYSYLVVLRFAMNFFKTKFKVAFFPAIFVFFLHSVVAVPTIDSLRMGFNVIVDCIIIYIVVLQLIENDNLMRKFIYAFLMGGIASGVYGWTSSDAVKEINISGAGAQTVKRNFGALDDSNFAGLFYSLCIVSAIVVKNIPKLLRTALIGAFLVMLMQTVSLSAMLTLISMLAFLIILKYRGNSVIMLFFGVMAAIICIAILMSIPQFREIEAVADLIIRLQEKLSYISRGRWDLLTTNRTGIWERMLPYFVNASLWKKLIGGYVITVHVSTVSACHNSYLQSLLNFGILGTLLIYLPLFGTFIHKLYTHFTTPKGYGNEDTKMISMIYAFSFIIFGMSVDFFIDWPFMLLFFV